MQDLYDELEQVKELLEEAHRNLHYWQGERGIQDVRNDITNLSVKITLLQEQLD